LNGGAFATIVPDHRNKEVRFMHTSQQSTDRLMRDLKAVVSDTQDLLKATAGDASERATKARAQAQRSLHQAQERLAEMEQHFGERARAAAHATNAYVHDNPWPSMGVAASVGIFLGLLIARR
jgi:ElaB/YqjD/DUF883 family membrane-anchored ribosome-binding protein